MVTSSDELSMLHSNTLEWSIEYKDFEFQVD